MSNKNIVSQLTLKEVEQIALEVVTFCQKNPDMLRDYLPASFEILVKYSVVEWPKQEVQKKNTPKNKSTKRQQQKNEVPSIIETYLTGSEREGHVKKIKDILNKVIENNSIDNEQLVELLRRICKTRYYDESTEEERSLIASLIKSILADKLELVFIQSKPSVFYLIDQYELSLSRDGHLVSIKRAKQEPNQSDNGVDSSDNLTDSKPDPQLFDHP